MHQNFSVGFGASIITKMNEHFAIRSFAVSALTCTCAEISAAGYGRPDGLTVPNLLG